MNSTFKPGCESLTFGATEGQSRRCYSHIEDWCYEHDPETGRRTEIVKPFILDRPLKAHTRWKIGSLVEIVAGSENAVSGPHPAKAHADEIDLMDEPVWNQSRGLAVTNPATGPLPRFMSRFNGMIPPQDIVTSTRNSTTGLMQGLLDEIADDVKNGDIPQFSLRTWCIWECIAEVPNCQNAPRDQRESRLKELGRDPTELCQCHRVAKGYHPDGTRRLLKHECGEIGKASPGHEYKGFRARGWKPYIDLTQTFKRNTPGTWTLQHLCRTGRNENSYVEGWSLNLYGIRSYEPHPLYGPIYQGIDWGAENPASVLWFQYLTSEVPAIDFEYQPIFLQPGIYVLFKEIYVSGLAAGAIAKRVVKFENEYREKYGARWTVKGRFADPQGKGDRITFANNGLKTSWPVKTRNKERMITTVQNLVSDDRFAVDVDASPSFCMEVEQWQKNPRTNKEVDKHNHAMSAWRYGISNAEIIEGRNQARGNSGMQRQRDDGEKKKMMRGRRTILPGEDRVNYGGIASTGETQVPINSQFSLSR